MLDKNNIDNITVYKNDYYQINIELYKNLQIICIWLEQLIDYRQINTYNLKNIENIDMIRIKQQIQRAQ